MAQFDIYRNADKEAARLFPFLLDIQHPLLDQLESRVVIPLTLPENLARHRLQDLNPLVSVNGKDYVLLTQQLAGVPIQVLGATVSSARVVRESVVAAIDLLVCGI